MQIYSTAENASMSAVNIYRTNAPVNSVGPLRTQVSPLRINPDPETKNRGEIRLRIGRSLYQIQPTLLLSVFFELLSTIRIFFKWLSIFVNYDELLRMRLQITLKIIYRIVGYCSPRICFSNHLVVQI